MLLASGEKIKLLCVKKKPFRVINEHVEDHARLQNSSHALNVISLVRPTSQSQRPYKLNGMASEQKGLTCNDITCQQVAAQADTVLPQAIWGNGVVHLVERNTG